MVDVYRNEHGTVIADWANMFAQVSVREGVQVAFLQRAHKLAHAMHLSTDERLSQVQGILGEWNSWFRDE